jgi:hypothetical protein
MLKPLYIPYIVDVDMERDTNNVIITTEHDTHTIEPGDSITIPSGSSVTMSTGLNDNFVVSSEEDHLTLIRVVGRHIAIFSSYTGSVSSPNRQNQDRNDITEEELQNTMQRRGFKIQ